jgi:hypothetical protein
MVYKMKNQIIKEGSTWLMPDDFVDKHCTPIIISVDSFIDGVVTYHSNYSTSQETMNEFEFRNTYKKSK